ncbi:MAG: hypothetical protein Q6K90_08055, partial [Gloeomargarita sp. HHBFW_bins_162]
ANSTGITIAILKGSRIDLNSPSPPTPLPSKERGENHNGAMPCDPCCQFNRDYYSNPERFKNRPHIHPHPLPLSHQRRGEKTTTGLCPATLVANSTGIAIAILKGSRMKKVGRTNDSGDAPSVVIPNSTGIAIKMPLG